MEITIAIFHGLGDCVNATTLILPITKKYKNPRITWISSESYLPLVYNNPYIANYQGIKGNPLKADAHYKNLISIHKKLITPAPYLNPPAQDRTLLGSYKESIKQHGVGPIPFRPIMYITPQEVAEAKKWLADREIDKFVMVEAIFTSSQSSWDRTNTNIALEIFKAKGYTVLFTHRTDRNLSEYNNICPSFCLDVGFRYMPVFYNLSQGFIGVSSGISCVVHTHQCNTNIPHLEFVNGNHWSTSHYTDKKNKKVIFNKNKDHFRQVIKKTII